MVWCVVIGGLLCRLCGLFGVLCVTGGLVYVVWRVVVSLVGWCLLLCRLFGVLLSLVGWCGLFGVLLCVIGGLVWVM